MTQSDPSSATMVLAGTEAGAKPTSRANTHLAYRRDIDGIRALAVIPIVLFHAFPKAIPGGFVGVDIFFVISGYLITGIVYGDVERGTFSFAAFYARRIRRIFPALIVMLAACFAFGWFTLLADEYAQLGKHIATSAVFVLNFVLAGEAGYFDVGAEYKPLLHLWSLAIEEQFYLFWPALLVVVGPRWRQALNVTAILALLSFAVNVALASRAPIEDFYLLPSRAWEFMSGGTLFLLSARSRGEAALCQLTGVFGRYGPTVLSSLGLTTIAVALFSPIGTDAYPGWWGLLPVMGTALLIGAGPEAWLNRTVLAHSLAVWFGLISYPLYLWHWPFLSYLRIVDTSQPPALLCWAAVGSSVVLAWLSYRFLERPIRRKRSRTVVVMLCLLMAIMGGIGYLASARGGLTSRLGHGLAFRIGPGYQDLLNSIEVGKDFGGRQIEACDSSDDLAAENCQRAAGSAPTAVVFGDSKAAALFPGLVRNSRPDMTWMMVAKGGCSPISGMVMTDAYHLTGGRPIAECDAFLSDGIKAIIGNPRIQTVVIAASHRLFDSQITSLDIEERQRQINALVTHLTKTVQIFRQANKKVVFLVDNPTLAEAKDCFPNRLYASQAAKAACTVSLRNYAQTIADYLAIIGAMDSTTDAIVVDPTTALCPDGVCRVIQGGRSLYSYTDHLSDYGNDIVGKQVISTIEP